MHLAYGFVSDFLCIDNTDPYMPMMTAVNVHTALTCFRSSQNVVDAMREALSAEFKAAVLTYDERPRTKWLTENSVQNTLTVSRLMFTADINAAFDEMEEGNAGALKVCVPKPAAGWGG